MYIHFFDCILASLENYEEEERRWDEAMQQEAQLQTIPRVISTSDFDYSLLNESE